MSRENDSVIFKLLKSADVINDDTQEISQQFDGESYPKLPEANMLELGEIALNIAKDYEVIAIKNNEGEIVYIPFNVAIRLLTLEGDVADLAQYTEESVETLSAATVSIYNNLEEFKVEISNRLVQEITSLSGNVFTTIDSLSATTDAKIAAEKERAVSAETALNTALSNLSNHLDDIIPSDTDISNKLTNKGYVDSEIKKITDVIPNDTSSGNPLTNEAFVNSSISTSTATFRGTYNLITDLHLTSAATTSEIAAAVGEVVLVCDKNDYAYVQIPTSETATTEILRIERYKYDGTAWDFEYALNNSGFTAKQWAAINSGIESGLVVKLEDLPNKAELDALFDAKQDKLTFDNTPRYGSNNPVTSGGIKGAVDERLPLSGGTVTGDLILNIGYGTNVSLKANSNRNFLRFNDSYNGYIIGDGNVRLALETGNVDLKHRYTTSSGATDYVIVDTRNIQENLTPNLKTLNGTPIVGSGDIDIKDNYLAIYRVTPYSSIMEAYWKGKVILVMGFDGIVYFLSKITVSEALFTHFDQTTMTVSSFTVNTSNVYSDITSQQLQENLVSGTNIKTINGNSVLGSGNIDVKDIFIVEYNVTTYQQVLDAYNAGKYLVLKYIHANPDDFDVLPLKSVIIYSDGAFVGTYCFSFSAIYRNQSISCAIDINGYSQRTTNLQRELTFDNTPTANSNNPVRSWGIKNALDTKQDTLVSGTNIKTINNNSILGDGNIALQVPIDPSNKLDADYVDDTSSLHKFVSTEEKAKWDAKLPLSGGTMSGDIDLDGHALLVSKSGDKIRNGIRFTTGEGVREGIYVGNPNMRLILEADPNLDLIHKKGDGFYDILDTNNVATKGNIYQTTWGDTLDNIINAANAGKIVILKRDITYNEQKYSPTYVLNCFIKRVSDDYITEAHFYATLEDNAVAEIACKRGPTWVDNGVMQLQENLVSGTNIKTINNQSVLGSGNLDVKDVFWVEYEETPFADILAAYNAGKTLFANYAGMKFVNTTVGMENDSNVFLFSMSGLDENGVIVIYSFVVTLNNGSTDYSNIYSKMLQEELISGTNIKTINGNSVLGSGNIDTQEVFVGQYGVTSTIDIEAARTGGKIVMMRVGVGDGTFVFSNMDYSYDQMGEYVFVALTPGNIAWFNVGSTRGYSPIQSLEVQSKLTFDNTPTSGSTNPVTSDGIKTAIDTKQDTLVSGMNIKTINNNSILGSGNIDVQPTIDSSHKLNANLVDDSTSTNKFVTSSNKTTWNNKQDALVSGTNIKTINNQSVLGSGNLDVKDVFIAEYNVTNPQDVFKAIEEGKLVIVKKSGVYYQPEKWLTETSIRFIGFGYLNSFNFFDLDSTTWGTIFSYKWQRADEKVSTITGNIDNIKYPTTKAVTDYAQPIIDSSNKLNADLVDDSSTTHKFVTANEKESWDNKIDKVTSATTGNFANFDSNGGIVDSGKKDSDFATAAQGSLADSAYQKPLNGIPASDIASGVIPDVSQFVTRSVNDLLNYYTKQNTYTKQEVRDLIGSIQHFHYEIYDSLQDITTPATNVLYLIGPSGSGKDKYEEYVYANSDFQKIGDTSIDLSNYVTTQALNTALANYVTSSALTTALAAKQDTLVSGTNIKTINNQSVLGSGDIDVQPTIDSTHKLDADLVDDTNSTHKFVTITFRQF